MSNNSQLKIGIVLSYLNLIIGNIIPIFYTPIMLRMLGQSEYGLFSLATSATSYLSLMSLGIGSAVVRYLLKYRTKNDIIGERKTLGLFSCIFFVIAALTIIVGFTIAFNIHLIYGDSLSTIELSKIKLLTFIITINSAVTFALSVFNSVVFVHERFLFRQILNIIVTTIPAFLNLLLIYLGLGSFGLVLSSFIVSVSADVAVVLYCFKKIKIKPIYRDMPFELLKEIICFSLFLFIGQIANLLYGATDKIIIGSYLGTGATAIFNVGLTFRHIVESLSTTASSLLGPKTTSMVFANASKEEMTDYMIKVGRLQFLLIGLALGGFISFGRPFVDFYAGPEYHESYFIAVLLMIPMVIPLIQNVGINILTALNKHQFRSIINLVFAIINVFTTIWFVKLWGIIGAAFTTFLCSSIVSVLIMNWYYYKKIHLNIPLFFKRLLPLLSVPTILTIATLIIAKFVDFSNLIYFFTGVIIYTFLYIIMIQPLLTEYEKNLLNSFYKKVRFKSKH